MANDTEYAEIETKINAGEKLTPAEMKAVMSQPNEDPASDANVEIDDSEFETDSTPGSKKKGEVSAEKSETKKVESPAPKSGEKKTPEDSTPAKKGEDVAESKAKVESELNKPDGKEDLANLTEREAALFWDMKRERRRAQKAEEERDQLRFKEIKRQAEDKAAKEAAAKEAEKKAAEQEKDPFEGRDPDEPLTIKEAQALLARQKSEVKKAKEEAPARTANFFDPEDPRNQRLMNYMDREAREEIKADDYDEVLECTREIITTSPSYLNKIGEALLKGENMPKLMYHLIKGDPEFTKVLPIAQARLKALGKEPVKAGSGDGKKAEEKSKTAMDAQKKLEENNKKPKTSAHAGGEDNSADTSKEYSAKINGKDVGYTQSELFNMDEFKFSKVPKAIRDKFMADMSGV